MKEEETNEKLYSDILFIRQSKIRNNTVRWFASGHCRYSRFNYDRKANFKNHMIPCFFHFQYVFVICNNKPGCFVWKIYSILAYPFKSK